MTHMMVCFATEHNENAADFVKNKAVKTVSPWIISCL